MMSTLYVNSIGTDRLRLYVITLKLGKVAHSMFTVILSLSKKEVNINQKLSQLIVGRQHLNTSRFHSFVFNLILGSNSSNSSK